MKDILKETRIFKECSEQELQKISQLCEFVSYKKDEKIFDARSPAEYLYIVADGAVELRFTVTHYLASSEITIDRKFKSDVFGWSALTKPHIYSLAAFAIKDTNLIRLHETQLKQLCVDNNHLGYSIMKNISEIIGERFDIIQKMLIDVIQQHLSKKEL